MKTSNRNHRAITGNEKKLLIAKPSAPRKKEVAKRPHSKRIRLNGRIVKVRYADGVEKLISTESVAAPIQYKIKVKKSRLLIAKILKSTGVQSIIEIGESIAGRY